MQLRSEAILPRISIQSHNYKISKQCSICKRNGYFNDGLKPFAFAYKNVPEALLQKNVLETYECFGYSALRTPFKDSGFAAPLLVVSQRIVEIFRNKKIKGVEFIPIVIDGISD